MIAYTLSMIESNEIPWSITCKEAINSGETTEWTVALTEEM